jgi:hypothetical protein
MFGVRSVCWVCFLIAGQLQEPLSSGGGHAAYGMQGMSSDVPEVRSVLGMLPVLGSCRSR